VPTHDNIFSKVLIQSASRLTGTKTSLHHSTQLQVVLHTSDPIICLLNVPPCFHEKLGEALDKLSEMLATNMVLSIHVRDDWIREEGVHEPRLSVAFTMTGPPISEAVRSMVQSAIRETLDNPLAVVLLPNTTPHPIPWNRVEEIPISHTGNTATPSQAHE
jgi:hypothetical protein